MAKLGNALPYDEESLKNFSEINDVDAQRARELWRKHAPKTYADMMDAPLLGAGITALYLWDAQKRQYFQTRMKRYIETLELRNKAIEPFLNSIRLTMREVSARLQQGGITLADWQTEMMYLTKYSQMAAALIANGGIGNTPPADYLVIAAFILALLLFLQNFSEEIQSGKQVLNGLLLTRSDLYARAARDAYEEMTRYGMRVYAGMKLERRILDPQANHCVPGTYPDGSYWMSCPEIAAKGWQPVGTLPRIMDSPCRSNCKCHWEYS